MYTRHPGFQKGSKPLLALDNPFPMELPENLFGERWAFVQLPYSGTDAAASTLFPKNNHLVLVSPCCYTFFFPFGVKLYTSMHGC